MKGRKRKSPVTSAVKGDIRAGGRIWIEKDGQTLLAWGRVVLLERIREHGSISAAARSMEMGYRHAWELVNSMNELAPEPLVDMKIGGRKGGGTILTPAGEAAIAGFWKLTEDFKLWLQEKQSGMWKEER